MSPQETSDRGFEGRGGFEVRVVRTRAGDELAVLNLAGEASAHPQVVCSAPGVEIAVNAIREDTRDRTRHHERLVTAGEESQDDASMIATIGGAERSACSKESDSGRLPRSHKPRSRAGMCMQRHATFEARNAGPAWTSLILPRPTIQGPAIRPRERLCTRHG